MSTVVDDTNPNIVWSGSSWRNGDPADDPEVGRYFNSTFRHSVFNGDSVSITWKGKDIGVYGARRDNHGIYSVSLDAGEPQYFSGYASGLGQFQAALYATSGLADGQHTLKVTNENTRNAEQYPTYTYLDIDFFALTGELVTGGAAPSASSPTSSSSSAATSSVSSASTPGSSPSVISSGSATSSVPPSTDAVTETGASSQESSESPSDSSTAATISPTTASMTETTTVNVTDGQYSDTGVPRSATATEGVEEPKTTGTPNLPPASTSSGDIPGLEASPSSGGSSNKTTVAVSVSVITVAVVVILTVLGLYLYKRQKARREQEELQQAENLMSQRSWSY